MAKTKTIRQAYGVTLSVNGKDVQPGTAVTLPQDEADKLAAQFGVIPATAAQASVERTLKPANTKAEPDLTALQTELDEAQKAYDSANAALEDADAGDDEVAAFEKAEERLNAAEKALDAAEKQADGQ